MTPATPALPARQETDPDASAAIEAGGKKPSPGFRVPRGDRALELVQTYGLLLIWAVMLVTFSLLLPDSFPTGLNFRNIVGNQSVVSIVAIGAIIPLIGGHFDLSIGSMLTISTIATATSLSRFSAPVWLACMIGVGVGALVGLLNGVLVARVGLNSFIATLGVSSAVAGLVSWYTKGLSIVTGIPVSLTAMGSGTWLGVPRTLVFPLVVAIGAWYLLDHTPYGRYLHAVGSNPNAARLVGIDVARISILSFVLEGAIIGFAGCLAVARQGGGVPSIGYFMTLPVISAAFLGATSITPGRFNVAGTVIAVFFLATAVSGLSLFGVDNWVESLFNGVALLTAVSLSTFIGWRRMQRVR
jgi:ribose transport system permease protein